MGIIKELPRTPRGVMTIPSSEVMFDPWNDQEMARGWSPFLTMQDACAKSPSLRMSPPKDRGESSGGSADGEMRCKSKKNPNSLRTAVVQVLTRHENCVRF